MKVLGSIWVLPIGGGILAVVVFADSALRAFSIDGLLDMPGFRAAAWLEILRWFVAGFLGTIVILTYVRVARRPDR